MKKFFLNMVLDYAFDEIIKSLQKFAQRSSSKIDNKMVTVIVDSKADIIADVKSRL